MSPYILNRRQALKAFGAVIGSTIGVVTADDVHAARDLPSLTTIGTYGVPDWSQALLCVNMISSAKRLEDRQQAHNVAVLRDAVAIAEFYTPAELYARGRYLPALSRLWRVANLRAHLHSVGDMQALWRLRTPLTPHLGAVDFGGAHSTTQEVIMVETINNHTMNVQGTGVRRRICNCQDPPVLLATYDDAGRVNIKVRDRFWHCTGRCRPSVRSAVKSTFSVGPADTHALLAPSIVAKPIVLTRRRTS